jgi:transposase-like protein
MLKNGKRIKHKRIYAEDFKLRMVKLFESGERTVRDLAKEYGLNINTLYRWIYKYSEYNKKSIQIVEMKDSQQHKIQELEQKVRELEQAVGQKQMSIDYLEKMIELAKEHYDIDIKKNSKTPPSGGSKTTGTK